MVRFVPLFHRLLGHFLPQCAVNHFGGDVANRYRGERGCGRAANRASALGGAPRNVLALAGTDQGGFGCITFSLEIAAMTLNGNRQLRYRLAALRRAGFATIVLTA
jgi:hypothetical protein